MEIKDGEIRSPQSSQQPKNSQFTSGIRSLGSIPAGGSKHGVNTITVSGEDSCEPDTVVTGQQSDNGLPGKIVGQLFEENEKQLAYHQQQVEIIKARIESLRQVPQTLTK
jgi:hypothetical protein